MRIISPKPLREFYQKHPDAEGPIRAWLDMAEKADWHTFHDLKRKIRNASIIGNKRAVFNIKGNSYRLVTRVDFEWRALYVRFIGTHSEYDKIDALTV